MADMYIETRNERLLETLLIKYSPRLPVRFFIQFHRYCLQFVNNNNLSRSSVEALQVTDLWLNGHATDEELTRSLCHANDPCVSNMRHIVSRMNHHNIVFSIFYHMGIGKVPSVKDQICIKYKAEFVRMLKSLSKVEKTLYDVEDHINA